MMPQIDNHNVGPSRSTTFKISTDEHQREQILREHFTRFWATNSGEPRAIYDAFIEGTPLAEDISLTSVDEEGVKGWWARPANARSDQVILYLHGGGYVLGSAKAYRGFISQIAQRTQTAALAIDYPLAPESTLPAAPDAAMAAWHWLVEQGFERIALAGDSAGGGLALATLAGLARQQNVINPVAGVVFSPWTDLTFSGASMTDASVEDPLIGYPYLQQCARQYLGGCNAADPRSSPLFADLEHLPPLLIQVGSDERLLDDSRQFAARAALAGVAVELEIWDGMHHVFQLDVAHLHSSGSALDRVARFLQTAFKTVQDPTTPN